MTKFAIYFALFWMTTALRLPPTFEQASLAAAAIRPAPMFTKNMKLIQFIGDSVDRYLIDDWCEHYQKDGSFLLFGQKPDERFGHWSNMGKIDPELAKLFHESHVGAWKSWQARICVVQRLGVAAAFVFNPKGVSTQGPWWHQGTMEKLYSNSFCGSDENPTPDCHDHSLYLGQALRAIQARTQLTPHATVFSSNAWDVDRLRFYKQKPWESFEDAGFLAEWQHNATELINAIKPIVPNSRIIWHTTSLGPYNNEGFTVFSKESPSLSKNVDQMELDIDSMILPGSHLGIHALNSAARKMCKNEHIAFEEMERDGIEYRDRFHPTPEVLVELMENLVKRYL